MKPHFSDSEARAILEDRKRRRDAEWLLGQIGEATYLRSLMILGYLEKDARTELSLLGRPKNG
jgi:hypothetical protein